MNEFLEAALEMAGSEEDAKRGFMDVTVRTRDGAEHVLRLTGLHSNFVERVLKTYAKSEDPRDLVAPMLAPREELGAFLDSILPQDMLRLAQAAGALLIGPEKLKRMVRDQLKAKGIA